MLAWRGKCSPRLGPVFEELREPLLRGTVQDFGDLGGTQRSIKPALQGRHVHATLDALISGVVHLDALRGKQAEQGPGQAFGFSLNQTFGLSPGLSLGQALLVSPLPEHLLPWFA
jgi:hypothetical protein